MVRKRFLDFCDDIRNINGLVGAFQGVVGFVGQVGISGQFLVLGSWLWLASWSLGFSLST